jgi:hypothetical protein
MVRFTLSQGFHADPRFTAVDPRFNEQGNSQYLKAEAFVNVLRRFSCWSIMAEYVNRHGDENEFRISINLLGVGQVGTSARAGF